MQVGVANVSVAAPDFGLENGRALTDGWSEVDVHVNVVAIAVAVNDDVVDIWEAEAVEEVAAVTIVVAGPSL